MVTGCAPCKGGQKASAFRAGQGCTARHGTRPWPPWPANALTQRVWRRLWFRGQLLRSTGHHGQVAARVGCPLLPACCARVARRKARLADRRIVGGRRHKCQLRLLRGLLPHGRSSIRVVLALVEVRLSGQACGSVGLRGGGRRAARVAGKPPPVCGHAWPPCRPDLGMPRARGAPSAAAGAGEARAGRTHLHTLRPARGGLPGSVRAIRPLRASSRAYEHVLFQGRRCCGGGARDGACAQVAGCALWMSSKHLLQPFSGRAREVGAKPHLQ